ncbi:MAG: ABC-2 family transporter protein [Pirellulales bacterium]
MSNVPVEPSTATGTAHRPAYLRVLLTFARNSLVRDMTFRLNFIIECVTSLCWMLMNLGFYILIFNYTPEIGAGTGWGKYQFFVFLATTLLVNSFVQGVFMTNFNEFSELIRTGNLDFALLKPIDTQFVISLARINWTFLANFSAGLFLLVFSLWKLAIVPGLWQLVLYPLYVVCGIAILYSLMIVLASLSVWLGRNQSLYDFWFYITNFSRYPMEIYRGTFGDVLRLGFTFVVPILIVVNVPARLMAWPLAEQQWGLAAVAIVATAASLFVSRRVFLAALAGYRSASS